MNNSQPYVRSPVLEVYRDIQNIVILVALISSYLFVFIRLKFKIDISGVLTLILILIAAIIRLLTFFSLKAGFARQIIQLETQILVWYSLYYFVIEMLKVKHKIESLTVSEARSKARRDRLCHQFLIFGFLAYMGL